MNRHLLYALLALYPRAFRDRYGTELAGLTDELIRAGEITPLLAALNLVGGAALEWGRMLTGSGRAGLAVAATAIMAAAGSFILVVAGIFYVTSQTRPPSTPARVHRVSAPAVIAQAATGCAVGVNPASPRAVKIAVGTNAAAKAGQAFEVLVPVMVLMPGTLSTQTGPWPSPVPVSAQLSSAGPCVAMVHSGFAVSRNLTAGSVLTIDGLKFTIMGIIEQPQASNPPDVSTSR